MALASLLKQYVLNHVETRLSAVLSAVAFAFALALMGALALLLLFFSLAFLIGELCGSLWIGFASLTAFALLALALVACNRSRWIERPICRLVEKRMATLSESEASACGLTAKRTETLVNLVTLLATVVRALRGLRPS